MEEEEGEDEGEEDLGIQEDDDENPQFDEEQLAAMQ